jgi:hypothetical protein
VRVRIVGGWPSRRGDVVKVLPRWALAAALNGVPVGSVVEYMGIKYEKLGDDRDREDVDGWLLTDLGDTT